MENNEITKIYITSDFHFGHDRDFLYKPRGFNDSLSHDIALVLNYNSVVNDEDDVYILGDITLGDTKWGMFLLSKLKGKKHIIIGNHDSELKVREYEKLGIDCKYADIIKYGKYRFYLSHYPTHTGNQHKKMSTQLINLYGHTHQKTNFYNDNKLMYHVGVDSHDNKPILLDDIIKEIKENYNV